MVVCFLNFVPGFKFAEIHSFTVKKLKNVGDFQFCSDHIGIKEDDRPDQVVPVGKRPAIFRRRYESASLNSKWLRNGSKKSGLGVIFTPRLPYEG